MEDSRFGNAEFIGEINTRLVLQCVRIMQPTFRAAVARQTGLNPATVTGIVQNLLDRNVLEETQVSSPGKSAVKRSGGRPPRMLRVSTKSRHILAVDLEPDCVRVALANILAEPLTTRERLIDRRSDSRLIVRQMIELCREVSTDKQDTMGLGLSLPGIIDTEAGIAISSTNMPNWRDVPIVQALQDALGMPVKIGRSMHLAAQHERWLHPELQTRRVVLLSLRTGIGMCLMDDGQIYSGYRGFAGEIGHTVIDFDGPACECGNNGCLETFVSASSVIARAREMFKEGRGVVLKNLLNQGEPLRPELIYGLAQNGDADCAAIVRDMGRYIGIAAANLINLLAPDDLVIAGSIDMADQLILEEIRKQVDQRALPRSRDGVSLRLASAKEKAPLFGAAVLVAGQAFELPGLRSVIAPDDRSIVATTPSEDAPTEGTNATPVAANASCTDRWGHPPARHRAGAQRQ